MTPPGRKPAADAGDKMTVTLRLPRDLRNELAAAAGERKQSMSYIVEQALRQYLSRKGAK